MREWQHVGAHDVRNARSSSQTFDTNCGKDILYFVRAHNNVLVTLCFIWPFEICDHQKVMTLRSRFVFKDRPSPIPSKAFTAVTHLTKSKLLKQWFPGITVANIAN